MRNRLLCSSLILLSLALLPNQISFAAAPDNGHPQSAGDMMQFDAMSQTYVPVQGQDEVVQISPPAQARYLIEFTDNPASVELAERNFDHNSTRLYVLDLRVQIDSYVDQIAQVVSGFQTRNIRKFALSIAGVSFDGSESEVAQIRSANLPFIRNVHQILDIEAHIIDSVVNIGAPQVWENGFDGTGVTVAVVDTGIDYTHVDLGACEQMGPDCRVAGGKDLTSGDGDPMDDNGHGTHVAGIIAGNAVSSDGSLVRGVAPGATMYAFKVLNASGSGSSENIIRAYESILDYNEDNDLIDRLDVVNLSIGATTNNPEDVLAIATDNLVTSGVVVVASAGNSGQVLYRSTDAYLYGPRYRSIASPSSAAKAISVGAVDNLDQMAGFSSRGPLNNGAVKPDVVAPGVAICSTQWDNAFPGRTCNGANDPHDAEHVSLSGTSMSAPHVSGVAVLLKQIHSDWNPDEIKSALRNSALRIDSTEVPGHSSLSTGAGRIRALDASLAERPTVTTIARISDDEDQTEMEGRVARYGFEVPTNCSYEFEMGHLGNLPGIYQTDTITSPDQWEVVSQGVVQVGPAMPTVIALPAINKRILKDGTYLARLRVHGPDGENIALYSFDVDNIKLRDPFSGDVKGRGFPFIGSIFLSPGYNYTIEWAPFGTEMWHRTGIGLKADGRMTRVADTLGEFASPAGTTSGLYKFRVVVNDDHGLPRNMEEVALIGIDVNGSTQSPSSPFHFHANPSYYPYAYQIPLIKDVDPAMSNGKEISILGKSLSTLAPIVNVFSRSFALRYLVQAFDGDPSTVNPSSLQVDDFDNDGEVDFAISRKLSGDGAAKMSIETRNNGEFWSQQTVPSAQPINAFTVLSDVDGDGAGDLVFPLDATAWRRLYVTDRSGNVLPGWPQEFPNNGIYTGADSGSPVIGNFDDDPQTTEIAYAGLYRQGDWSFGVEVRVYNIAGEMLPNWPRLIGVSSLVFAKPGVSAADFDGDGRDELVVAGPRGIWVYDTLTAQTVDGWPQLEGYSFATRPAIADMNGDGWLDIIFTWYDSSNQTHDTERLYVYNYDGTVQAGFPVELSWRDYEGPVIADIDGDGNPDILHEDSIFAGGVFFSQLHARKGQGPLAGTELPGFPKLVDLSNAQGKNPVDIDNDGMLDLISTSNGLHRISVVSNPWRGPNWGENVVPQETLYGWELDVADSAWNYVWPTSQHSMNRDGHYRTVTPPLNSRVMGSSSAPMLTDATLRWERPLLDDTLTGYTVQISRDRAFQDPTATIINLPATATSYRLSRAQNTQLNYVRVGSRSSDLPAGKPLWARTLVVGTKATMTQQSGVYAR